MLTTRWSVVLFALFILTLSKVELLDDVVSPGDEIELYTSLFNDAESDFDDVRVVAYVMDNGDSVEGPRFDVDDMYGRVTTWDAPADSGEYLVRVSASNDDFSIRK